MKSKAFTILKPVKKITIKTLSQYTDNEGQNFQEASLIYSQGNLIACLLISSSLKPRPIRVTF